MNEKAARFERGLKLGADLVAVSLAWILAYYLRFYAGWAAPLGVPPAWLYFKLLPFIVVIWLLTASASGFYQRALAKRSAFREALDIIPASALAVLGLIAFSYFYEEYRYSRLTMLLFALLTPTFLIIQRSLLRKGNRRAKRALLPRRSLIIAGASGLRLTQQLAQSDGAAVVGVVLLSGTAMGNDRAYLQAHGLAELPLPENWLNLVQGLELQTVYCGVPLAEGAALNSALVAIADQVPDIRILPDLSPFTRLTPGIEMVAGIPVVSLHDTPLEGLGGILKRLLDIIGAVLALLVFGPIMATIAIMVLLSSRGPVLYRQERMGLDGRTFKCLKFRSMPLEAEKGGPVFAAAGDQRATWLGRILRRTSLDELPQLFNVLRGEMSLVGPRPERPIFVGQFRSQIPGYMLRHKVKAGMTGWAQVNGWRGNTSIERRIDCDLYYIQHWSVILDFKILLMTVREVLFGRNAY